MSSYESKALEGSDLNWEASVAYSRLQDAAKANPKKSSRATISYCEKVRQVENGYKLKDMSIDNPKCQGDGYQLIGYVTTDIKADFAPFVNPKNPPKVAYVPKNLRPVDTGTIILTGGFGATVGGFCAGLGVMMVTSAAAMNPLVVGIGAVLGAGIFLWGVFNDNRRN